MRPYDLTNDLEKLRTDLLRRENRPSGNGLGINWEGAVDEFLSFATCYNLSEPQIAHKCSHTLRVASNAIEIARRASSVPLYEDGHEQRHGVFGKWVPDGSACLLLGLLHDVGRFPQYAMYRTYSDSDSISHAELSYSMLHEFKMARQFANITDDDSDGQELLETILRAIRIHSNLTLGHISGPERAYADIIRDADKMDILEEYCHAISAEDFAEQVSLVADAMRTGKQIPSMDAIDAPFICSMARMSDEGFSVSEPVMADVIAGGLVDRTNITTAGDEIAMTMSLFVDIETKPAQDMLASRGTMARIREAVIERYGKLDDTGTLMQAIGRIMG